MSLSASRAQLASTVAEALMYGINLVVFIVAMTLILTRRERNPSGVTIALGIMTVLTFALATVHLAAVGGYTFREFISGWMSNSETPSRSGDPLQILGIMIGNINCFLGDSLVIWRAWGLCGRSYRAILIPALLWVATLIVGTVGVCLTGISFYLHPHPVTGTISIWLASSPSHSAPGVTYVYASSMLVWAALVLATNLWTVGMIGSVYWRYHQEVVVVVGRRRAACRIIFIFLIESGALYCITWVVMVVLIALNNRALPIIARLAFQFSCLYPTLIIVVVCLGLTQQDRMDSDSTLSIQQGTHRSIEFRRPEESTLEMRASGLYLPPARRSTDTGSIADKVPQDAQFT